MILTNNVSKKRKQAMKSFVVVDDDDDFVDPQEHQIKQKTNTNMSAGPSHQKFVPYTDKKLKARVGYHYIHVTSQTVKDVLGIPLGRLPVNEKNKPRMGSSDTLRIWTSQYPGKSRITDLLVQIDQKIEDFDRLGNDINELLTSTLKEYPSSEELIKRKNNLEQILGVLSKVALGLGVDKGPVFEKETDIISTFVQQEMVEACENVEQQLSTSKIPTNQPIVDIEETTIDLDIVIPDIPFLQPENVQTNTEKTNPEAKTPALEIRF
ncbi:hypothetical protein E3N88_10424 [Mikania micrantha]|uniref:Uncharacterized protein n=1 Tax=Mikania micrantha TaxID=192012 RepID=A0A5N6PAS6_9ASTR|nr:hypothetical protein E3N88_10424 [Mikania micrantha]